MINESIIASLQFSPSLEIWLGFFTVCRWSSWILRSLTWSGATTL